MSLPAAAVRAERGGWCVLPITNRLGIPQHQHIATHFPAPGNSLLKAVPSLHWDTSGKEQDTLL